MNSSSREVLRFGGAAVAVANAVGLLFIFTDAWPHEEAINAAQSISIGPTLLLIIGLVALAVSHAGVR